MRIRNIIAAYRRHFNTTNGDCFYIAVLEPQTFFRQEEYEDYPNCRWDAVTGAHLKIRRKDILIYRKRK